MSVEAQKTAPAISPKLQGHLAMGLFAFLISFSFFIGKRAAPHIDPAALTAVRYMVAIPILAVIAYAITPRADRQTLIRPKAVWRFPILGGLMGIYFILMFVALRLTSSVSTVASPSLLSSFSVGSEVS